jgi:hypothetical protein
LSLESFKRVSKLRQKSDFVLLNIKYVNEFVFTSDKVGTKVETLKSIHAKFHES